MEQHQNQAPTIAHLDDIDRQFAERAFTNTSHSPERRGEQERNEYAEAVNGLYAELWPLAKSPEQKALLAEEMERYRQGYLERKNASLASHAHVASAFIVGPARFPTERMRKRRQWADNKANDLLEWDKTAQAAIKRKLLDARTQEEKDAAEWAVLHRDVTESLARITDVDENHSPWTRCSFVNSIAGKVERLALAGEVELVRKAQQLVREHNASHKKPAISARHSFWKLEDVAKQSAAKHQATSSEEPEVIAEGKGVVIIVNHQADRVQIVFDARPSVEMIGTLKGEAWNWSRTRGAWQRKITEAAKASAKRITGLV